MINKSCIRIGSSEREFSTRLSHPAQCIQLLAWSGTLTLADGCLLGRFVDFKTLPEAKCLIRCHTGHGGAIWGESQGQDASRVPGKVGYSSHGRVLPDGQLVLRVTVTGDKLTVMLRPQNGRDLQCNNMMFSLQYIISRPRFHVHCKLLSDVP